MPGALYRTLVPAAQLCRTVAAALIAGLSRRLTIDEVEARLKGQSLRDQALIVGGVLAMLFLCSLLAAQFGLVGLALFGIAVVLIVR